MLLVFDAGGPSDLAVKTPVVEPVDVLGVGDLGVVDAVPWAIFANQLCLEQRVRRRAMALSYESPFLPTEFTAQASASRSVYRIARY